MKRTWWLLTLVIFTAAGTFAFGGDSGTFRGKWWNYYERGLEYAEKGDWGKALGDLREAASQRGTDQRMARTYGMHFIDYYPHRELGVVYYHQGEMEMAARELEESVKTEETAKAVFYLNKVKEQQLRKDPIKAGAPEITVVSPADGSTVKTSTVVVKGRATGKGHVARLTINGTPYRFERARENLEFTQEVPVEDGANEIRIVAEDLLGNMSEKAVALTVDRDGPSIQIFDIKAEEEHGKKYLRVTGEISDATWISRLQVNGAPVDAGGAKSHPLNFRYERGSRARLTVLATDPFENETAAEIDVEKDLAAFNRPFEPFQVALNAGKLIGFDKRPPEASLRTAEGLPPVFAGKYAVEGVASDDWNVGRITVNGREVYFKKGKKVFFSKVVDLREGKNAITVDIYDSSENKTSRTFTVTRKIPSVLQNASRMSITVLPFDGGQAADRVRLAYDQLVGAFVEQKRFSIVERSKLEQILLEQKLTREKLTDPENSIRIGKLMSADAVLAATVREDGKSLEIVARIISTETSEVLDVKDVYAEDKTAASVKELMAALASKVASGFPVAEGMVVKAGGRSITMDLGEASNIKKNMTVIIYRKGEEIRHPVTGKSLGFDTVKLAEGRVEDVQANFSKVALLKKPASQEVRVKDLVITK